MSPPRDEDLERLAGEHALGLLEGAELARAEALLADREYAAALARWRARFAELDGTAAPLTPAPDLWARIERSLDGPAAAGAAPVVVPDPVNAFGALWRSLAFWRFAGLAGAAASILLAVGVATFATRAARQPVMVAVLVTELGARPAAIVNTFADGRAELLPLESIDVPQGRALEIWTLWDRAVGPRSVGLIDRARSTPLDLRNLPRTGANQLFEITLEPEGGSPTGRPTGPILMKGTTATPL